MGIVIEENIMVPIEKDFEQAINRVYHGQVYPSHLVLPVIERDR